MLGVFFDGEVGPPDISHLLLNLRPAVPATVSAVTAVAFRWPAAADICLDCREGELEDSQSFERAQGSLM